MALALHYRTMDIGASSHDGDDRLVTPETAAPGQDPTGSAPAPVEPPPVFPATETPAAGRSASGRDESGTGASTDFDDVDKPEPVPYTPQWPVVVLAVLGILFALHHARPVLAPIVSGLVLALLLVPAVSQLERLGIGASLSSGLVVLSLLAVTAFTVQQMSGPALNWLDRAPQTMSNIRERLRPVRDPVAQISQAAQEVTRLAPGAEEEETRPRPTPAPTSQGPSLSSRVLDQVWRILSGGVITAVLVFFLLSYRNPLVRKVIRVLPEGKQREGAAKAVTAVRSELSTHLATISFINAGLGVAVGVSMWLLGLPSPALWGVMAAFLNFVPYLGALVGVGVVTLVGLSSLDTITAAFVAGGVYALLTAIEGFVVTPAIAGKRLRINPVAVLLGVLLGGFLWGVLGVLLAVPSLIVVRALAQHHPRGRAVAILLGR